MIYNFISVPSPPKKILFISVSSSSPLCSSSFDGILWPWASSNCSRNVCRTDTSSLLKEKCTLITTPTAFCCTFTLMLFAVLFVLKWGFVSVSLRLMGNWKTTNKSQKYTFLWLLLFLQLLIRCTYLSLQIYYDYLYHSAPKDIPLCLCSSSFSSCVDELSWPRVSCSCSKDSCQTETSKTWLKQQVKYIPQGSFLRAVREKRKE